MRIAVVTAGGAGMFCGSCMHDNTLARALLAAGHDVTLIPLYTPIRVDEENVSQRRVFLGGVNVYLAARYRWWNRVPHFLRGWLDGAGVLKLASRWGVSSDARELGALTVALLRGDLPVHREAIDDLVNFLLEGTPPDVVLLSNALLGGLVPVLRQRYPGRIWCLLQGDDIFLQDLVEPWRQQALERLRGLSPLYDGFLTHSAYYRDFMAELLGWPRERGRVVPLSIDLRGHTGVPRNEPGQPFTIGYFARICPEKGLQNLLAGFRLLHARQPHTRLVAAGYLGVRDEQWFEALRRQAADLGDAFEYQGSPAGHEGKVQFLSQLDLFSVPTTYREPKGLSVLEALANGVPVVQPAHGAFPELLERTGGGLLVPPDDPQALAEALERLLLDNALRKELAHTGQARVRTLCDAGRLAEETVRALR